MIYKKVVEGIFLKRPNRFIAYVLIDGKEEKVHVKNTGRCKELLVPGVKVILEDCSAHKNRKTRYSLIAVWKGNMLVNMDSQAPNSVVYEAVKEGKIDGFNELSHIKREVSYKKSRYDIYFENGENKGFIEVKGVTLEMDGISMFPDAPTERGTKHVLEMIEAAKEGYIGIILFLVQMKGPKIFKPNWKMDENFSKAIKLAYDKGIKILAYDSIVTENSIVLDRKINIQIQ